MIAMSAKQGGGQREGNQSCTLCVAPPADRL